MNQNQWGGESKNQSLMEGVMHDRCKKVGFGYGWKWRIV